MSAPTRRSFIARTAATLPAAGALLAREPLRHSNLGLQLYTVRNVIDKDPLATLRAIQSAGYAEVEAIYATLEKIWPALKQTGLKPVSVHADLAIFKDRDKLEPMLNDVKQRGFRYVVVPYIPPAERGGADMFKRLAETLNTSGERAKAHGLQLCYHNHAFEFAPVGESTGLELLMKDTQKDLVSLELDIFWVTVAGHKPVELLKTYSDRILLLHLKDKSRSFTKTQFNENVPKDTFKEIGNGSIDIPAVLAAAKSTRVQNYFVEQDQTPGDPIDSVRQSYDYLKKYFS